MNAFTSSDHTTYPFATTNQQDFRNLMDVYLDATLQPLLRINDFNQEGWRIGPENPLQTQTSGSNGLVFKGVVYNEMKGQMSDASYLYYIRFHEHLIPTLHNSGGDPEKMTDLTYDQLKKFHAQHYHPSNSRIFTYGDMPIEGHLERLNKVLSVFDRTNIDEDIKSPIDLSSGPQYVTIQGPTDMLVPRDLQYKTSVTWILGETSDLVERFSLSLLSSLLLDGYGSPFYQGLIEAGLGSDFTPNTGFSPLGKSSVFSVGLTGVHKNNVAEVKSAIFTTLEKHVAKGFDKIKVDGILHQLELGLKHKTAHFGMGLMQRIQPDWFNGVHPFDVLAWQKTLEGFKERHTQPRYLEGLLEKYFLNDNTLTFTMEPSERYSLDVSDEETTRLARKILETTKEFSTEDEALENLTKRELALLEEQEAARHQDSSCLPSVHVKDIPRVKPRKELRQSSVGDVKVQWREAPTNGLTYFRAISVLKDLPDELRELIPLFSDSIMRLGTKNMPVEQLEELIKLKTGGIAVGYHSSTSPRSLDQFEEGLVLSGHAFDRNVPALYDLLRTIIMETDFDSPEAERRILQLLQTSASGALDSVAEAGHAYARRYAAAGLTPEGRLIEQVSGLTQVKLTASLATRSAAGSLKDVIEKLKIIQGLAVSNQSSMRVALTCGTESVKENERLLDSFLSTLPKKPANYAPSQTTSSYPRNSKSFFPLPYQVYYSGVVLRTVPYLNNSGAALQVLSQLLTHKHLHHEIREKGGAYGGGAYSQGLGGVFGFHSYRDPNPVNTLGVVKASGIWARDRAWSTQDIEEAKLCVFQGLDAPESISQEGITQFLTGVDQDMQQRRREQLLDVTADDVKNVADEFLVKGIDMANVAVLGASKDWVRKEEGWEIRDLGIEQRIEELLDQQPLAAAGV
jgi:Zn-dependent M16 (insulinase) family peptidase